MPDRATPPQTLLLRALARARGKGEPRPARGFLAGLGVRKKLFVLHTLFTLVMAVMLILALRPAVREVVDRAETAEALGVLRGILATPPSGPERLEDAGQRFVDAMRDSTLLTGDAEAVGLSPALAASLEQRPRTPLPYRGVDGRAAAAAYVPGDPSRYVAVSVVMPEARAAVTRLFVFTLLALVGVYMFIAAAVELFVLPRHVYEPIQRMLDADQAVQQGRADRELIPEDAIPSDELGEIMRSRNESIVALRGQETQLSDALARLEEVASDLQRKNHLLETARRNLADADRLASLGMMSAGIAHELNTPLAVLKGTIEHIASNPGAGVDPARAALMLRVLRRIERLGESLLDFARVRPPVSRRADLREITEEAATLVRLDRGAGASIENAVPEGLLVECDADRMVQVLVNIIRNAAEAVRDRPTAPSAASDGNADVRVDAELMTRDGARWASVRVTDNGPGIDQAVLSRIFEPFATTRLDSRGTGLGLAVAEGIVREHGGRLLARNRPGRAGAVFEVLLPCTPDQTDAAQIGTGVVSPASHGTG